MGRRLAYRPAGQTVGEVAGVCRHQGDRRGIEDAHPGEVPDVSALDSLAGLDNGLVEKLRMSHRDPPFGRPARPR